MSGPNQNKPGKSGKPGRKPVQELAPKTGRPQSEKPGLSLNQKAVQPQDQKPEQTVSEKPTQPQNQTPEQAPSQQLVAQPQSADTVIAAAALPSNTLAVDFQAIATAYSDYTRKSFEDTKAFVEKLSGVRSLDKAMEIQTEFAKQAYETFVTESQKIRELYSGLAKQSFKPLEHLIAKATQAGR